MYVIGELCSCMVFKAGECFGIGVGCTGVAAAVYTTIILFIHDSKFPAWTKLIEGHTEYNYQSHMCNDW
jgi:hypothetical protein